ncbi:MAG: PaaI family thioesterase [Bradyrhizobiaceae bacterium]|nr:PaaI family thioesterase [Bradyrhizobiaceae bacterium]
MAGEKLKPRDPDWETKVRASFARQTFMDTIGARLSAVSPGRCEIELPFRRDLCQQHGFLHGGVVTAIAANAGGYAAFTLMPPATSVVGIEYKLNLFASPKGERVVARGRVVRPGKTLYVVEAEVEAESGGERRAIGRMLATMMCVEGIPEVGQEVRP